MPMISGPLKWYTVAERIRTAIHTDLTVKPDRSGVVPGAIAWDSCDCGILAVSIAQVYPSEDFPAPQATKSGRCDAPIEVAEIIIQIIRCVPGQEGLTPPTVAQLDTAAQEVALDAYETLRATSTLLCQMDADREIYDFLVRPQTARGPSGNCAGTELRALVALLRN